MSISQGYYAQSLRHAVADRYASGAATMGSSTYYRNAIGQIYDNFFFTCDVLRFADAVSADADRTSPVYRYLFQQRSPTNPWPKSPLFCHPDESHPLWHRWMGVMHGYEIEYFFGAPFREKAAYSQEDRSLSSQTMAAWANFARTGFLHDSHSLDSSVPTPR